MAAGWGLPARLAPLDLPGALARFLDQARPRLQCTGAAQASRVSV